MFIQRLVLSGITFVMLSLPAAAATVSYDATNAVSDPELKRNLDDHSIYINGDSFSFEDGAAFTYNDMSGAASLSGTALLDGVGFGVQLDLTSISWGTTPSYGTEPIEPKVEINLAGTGIDPLVDWTAYDFISGSLTVIGSLIIQSQQGPDGTLESFSFADGDVLSIFSRPPSGQYGFQTGEGANGKNLNYGLAGWFGLTGADGTVYCGGSYNVCDFNLDLNASDPEVVPLPLPFLLLPAGLGMLWSLRRRRTA